MWCTTVAAVKAAPGPENFLNNGTSSIERTVSKWWDYFRLNLAKSICGHLAYCKAWALFSQWVAASVSDTVLVRLSVCSESDMLENFTAFQIAKKHYWKCKTLKLPRFLQEQLLRASSSIGLNLAEGSGKRTPADQRRFYAIAFGSLRECQAILELEQINDPELKDLGNQLGAILFTLSRKPLTKNWTKTVSDADAAADDWIIAML